ncbi:MAG: phenylalanine--tRNA ligase subunit beta, partial [Candidatus Omnitrophica bacterium]|nr:phenylalanine--tRNA ligase subunit beta [Candidatus Omnitrophota bacterium]
SASGICVYAYSSGQPREIKKVISFDTTRLNKVLGTDIEAPQIKKILDSLGFKTKQKNKGILAVQAPSFRQDINIDMDLSEEVARIFGYENIEKSLPAVAPQIKEDGSREAAGLIKNILTGLGLNETVTLSLVDEQSLADFTAAGSRPIEVLNPLSQEQSVLRTTLVPSLSRCISSNLNQKQEYVSVFEMAKVFSLREGRINEEWALAIALSGTRSLWLEQGRAKEKMGFLHLKGVLEELFSRLGVKDYSFSLTGDPGRIEIILRKEKAGIMLKLKREALEKLDIKNKDVFAAEIAVDKILSCAVLKKKFTPLPLYPAISRDISVVLKDDIPVQRLLEVVRETAGPLLRAAEVIDCYKGKQIPDGFKGLTISCLYRSQDRTLTETEITPFHSAAQQALAEKFGIKLR